MVKLITAQKNLFLAQKTMLYKILKVITWRESDLLSDHVLIAILW